MQTLPDHDLEYGSMTLLKFLRRLAPHTEGHAQQIRNVRSVYEEQRSK
ncbi:MAG: hypothetical protein M3Y57_01425 [Acidobacteriota bacterium]|nr:hypothetical protein [Acidobacteriota bacterium]